MSASCSAWRPWRCSPAGFRLGARPTWIPLSRCGMNKNAIFGDKSARDRDRYGAGLRAAVAELSVIVLTPAVGGVGDSDAAGVGRTDRHGRPLQSAGDEKRREAAARRGVGRDAAAIHGWRVRIAELAVAVPAPTIHRIHRRDAAGH